jgi:hypothetical protein
MSWRARPLVSHDVIVNLIARTKTSTKLLVHADLDTNDIPKGVAVRDEEMASARLEPEDSQGEWNDRTEPRWVCRSLPDKR